MTPTGKQDARQPVPSPVATERMLGYLRIGGMLFGVVQTTLYPGPFRPPQARLASYALSLLLGLGGMATLHLLRSLPHREPRRLQRFMLATFAFDALVIVAFTLLYGFETDGGGTHLLTLLLPLEGALKAEFRGAMIGTGLVAVEELARAFVRIRVWGLPVEVADVSFLVLLALFVGAITGLLARSAERRRREAEELAAQAQALAAQVEASHRDLSAHHRVILAGIGGGEQEALDRMVAEIREVLGYRHVAVLLADEPRHSRDEAEPSWIRVAATAGERADLLAELRGAGVLAPDLREQQARLSSAGALEAGVAGPGLLVAPIRVRGVGIGALVVGTSEGGSSSVGSLQRLADQMGLVIEAARSFEREVELARRYRELDRLKTDFVAITSHELRTPLTAILGFAETLQRHREEMAPDMHERVVDGIVRQAQRLARLVNDLLTVSRLDAGTLTLNPGEVRIGDIVQLALETTGMTATVTVDGPSDARVLADPDRLAQIITNLLNNAAEHGAGAPVRVTWGRGEGVVEVRVRDEGPGIRPEDRAAVFARFYQSGNVLSHQSGSGLGLAIARELAEAMGGQLHLEESWPRGATFLLRLPAAEAASAEEPAPDAAAMGSPTGSARAVPERGARPATAWSHARDR